MLGIMYDSIILEYEATFHMAIATTVSYYSKSSVVANNITVRDQLVVAIHNYVLSCNDNIHERAHIRT